MLMRIKLQIVPRTADRKQNPRQDREVAICYVETETARVSVPLEKERVVIERVTQQMLAGQLPW